jgi:hypothetical protein
LFKGGFAAGARARGAISGSLIFRSWLRRAFVQKGGSAAGAAQSAAA